MEKSNETGAMGNASGCAPVVSLVVPCYCEEEMLPASIPVLTGVLDDMIRDGVADPASEVILVDDGSTDGTWEIIKAAHASSPMIRGVRLLSNRGQANAHIAGFEASKGDFIITIDADLQDDVSAIRTMVMDFRNGIDVVYGVKKARTTDTFFKRFSAQMFYKLMAFFGVDLIYNHSSFRGMSRQVLEALGRYREKSLFIHGLVRQLGFRSSIVYYDRRRREAGETKFSLRKMIAMAIFGITSFTFVPLRLVTILGLGLCAWSFVLIVWILFAKYVSHTAIPGWASMLVVLSVFGGVQLFCLGIIGEYLAIIFNEVKDRPRFHVAETTESGPAPRFGANTNETCGGRL